MAVAATAREVILHGLVVPSLVAAILALAPAAHASSPDQSWIAGLYDNADFDDVILFITSGLGGLGGLGATNLGTAALLAGAGNGILPLSRLLSNSSSQSVVDARDDD